MEITQMHDGNRQIGAHLERASTLRGGGQTMAQTMSSFTQLQQCSFRPLNIIQPVILVVSVSLWVTVGNILKVYWSIGTVKQFNQLPKQSVQKAFCLRSMNSSRQGRSIRPIHLNHLSNIIATALGTTGSFSQFQLGTECSFLNGSSTTGSLLSVPF